MSDILVASLNPCLDWEYTVPQFAHGGLNRVTRTFEGVGGKGINVAVALKNLGENPRCIGFNFTGGGQKVTEKLDAHGIPHDFVMVDGHVRVNIKLYEESGMMTELNQPGDFVPDFCVEKITSQVRHDDLLILTGSLPPGVPTDIYATLTALHPGKVILDASGEALLLALQAGKKPYAIKPNLYELNGTFGVNLQTPQEIISFCRANITDVPVILVSMGEKGAVLVTPDTDYFQPSVKAKVHSLQGAGDAMVAGFAHGLMINAAPQDLLRYAMAAATATVILPGTQMCTREGFEEFFNWYENRTSWI